MNDAENHSPRYRFSPALVAEWLATTALNRKRDFAQDAARALRPHRHHLRYEGMEHVPDCGAFMLASNHYSRARMGTWWTALAITDAVAQRRPNDPICWMHTDRFGAYRLFGLVRIGEEVMVPILCLFARTYGFLQVPRDDTTQRAPMLREAFRRLHREQRILGIMPEGGSTFEDGSLGPENPGAGAAIAWLTAGRLPVLPVAVFEEPDRTLVVRFGPTMTLPPRQRGEAEPPVPASASEPSAIMSRIIALMPSRLRGVYAAAAR